jgi:hypothetical protein
MMEAMIPIAALGESQSWRDGSLWINVKHERERLHARLTIEGHYGDQLPPEDWQQAAFERAIAGFECEVVDWPTWAMPPDAWPTVVARLGASLHSRLLRYERSDPALASLLAAQLRGRWSVRLVWQLGVTVEVDQIGSLMIHGTDELLDALLRGHAGLVIDAQSPLQDQRPTIDPATAIAFFERIASWSPQELSWVQAWVYVE